MRNDYGIRPKAAAGEGMKKMKMSKKSKMESTMKTRKSMEKPLKKEVKSGSKPADDGTKMMGSKKPKMGD